MIFLMLATLAITFAATWWSRQLALHRKRHVGGWALATAFLPPVVLLLWALPARAV